MTKYLRQTGQRYEKARNSPTVIPIYFAYPMLIRTSGPAESASAVQTKENIPPFLLISPRLFVPLQPESALVVELVDTPDLGSGAFGRVSSSLIRRTTSRGNIKRLCQNERSRLRPRPEADGLFVRGKQTHFGTALLIRIYQSAYCIKAPPTGRCVPSSDGRGECCMPG